jgi:hypothetical protein
MLISSMLSVLYLKTKSSLPSALNVYVDSSRRRAPTESRPRVSTSERALFSYHDRYAMAPVKAGLESAGNLGNPAQSLNMLTSAE